MIVESCQSFWQQSTGPIPVRYTVCRCCVQNVTRLLDDLFVGNVVVAKHKNGRFYHSSIVAVVRHKLYEVDFDDGSVSYDLLPEDIVVSGCASWSVTTVLH